MYTCITLYHLELFHIIDIISYIGTDRAKGGGGPADIQGDSR